MSDNIQTLLDELVVLNGPFKGLKYPNATSIGSTLHPKILGSYELEIQGRIKALAGNDYQQIINIGCGEGYYAVGLAKMFPEAKTFAFDNNEAAIVACREMAENNDAQVAVGGFCDKGILLRLAKGRKSLIVCDCESYEKELFDKEVAVELAPHDLIIETHDFIDIGITRQITEAFQDTHNLEVIESTDDISKAYNYDFPELSGLNLWERRCILEERRPTIMRWICAMAR